MLHFQNFPMKFNFTYKKKKKKTKNKNKKKKEKRNATMNHISPLTSLKQTSFLAAFGRAF